MNISNIAENTQLHNVGFWIKENNDDVCVFSFWTVNPPNYQIGQTVHLHSIITAPTQKISNFYTPDNVTRKIVNILHDIEITIRSNYDIDFFHKLEITLE